MSDKETAPWIKKVAAEICGDGKIYIRGGLSKLGWPHSESGWVGADELAQIIAVGCTAPAPQPAELPTLEEWMLQMYPGANLDKLEIPARVCIEIAKSYAAATPQVTPEKAIELLVAVRDYAITEEGLCSVCLADPHSPGCVIDLVTNFVRELDAAPRELANAINAVYAYRPEREFPGEGTSEQAPQELELEQEADGRWLAEFMRFPGIAAYGPSKEEAIRNAAKVLIESERLRSSRLSAHGVMSQWRENVADSELMTLELKAMIRKIETFRTSLPDKLRIMQCFYDAVFEAGMRAGEIATKEKAAQLANSCAEILPPEHRVAATWIGDKIRALPLSGAEESKKEKA